MSAPRRLVIFAMLALVLVGGWSILPPRKIEPPPAGPMPARSRVSPSPRPRRDPAAGAEAAAAIDAALTKLRGGADAAGALAQLREALSRVPEEVAAAAIVDFLKSGENAPTGLPFRVGADGAMATVPTLRLALLDGLPSLDPLAALEVAREIMDQKTSPDEYALALRNLAWNDLDGDLRDELDRRFTDLLAIPWLSQPTAGVLEAFDIAVELGDRNTFGTMVEVARQATADANEAVSRAAYISLDRMILRDPGLLDATGSGWMDFAPLQRASLLSRLDPSHPGQREILARYLNLPSHGPGELDYFSRIFPNRNFLYGHRLVTADEASPSLDEVAAADALTLAALSEMEGSLDGAARETLATIQARLAEFQAPGTSK